MDKIIILNKKKIEEFQQNRDSYLMIDHATKIIPGKISEGYKILRNDEWFFKIHWPTDPNMPGMLQIEALVQMSSLAIVTLPGNKGKILYLVSATNLKFIKKVVPGDTLQIKTKIKSFKRGMALCSGIGFVDERIVCSADFILVLPDLIKSYTDNK